MKRLALVLVVACGGGGKSSTLDNKVPAPALALATGAYPCAFIYQGQPYGPFKCTVAGDAFTKIGGMEQFTGKLTPRADGVHLDAKLQCNEVETNCGPFSIDLVKGSDGTYRGIISGGSADWWLANQGFQITNAGMGGDQYGGAGYGGATYGTRY